MQRALIACLACAAAHVMSGQCASEDTITLQNIMEAWKQTQESVRAAEFHWTTKRWIRKGALKPPFGARDHIPPEDVTIECTRALMFRDGLVRYESNGQFWDYNEGRFVDRPQIYVWDGESATSLDADRDKPYAMVYRVNQQLTENELRPVQFAFRMFHPEWYVFDPTQYDIAPMRDMIDGLPSVRVHTSDELLEEKMARGRRQLRAVFWALPQRHFSVVRYAAIDEGARAVTLQFDVRHEYNSQDHLWVPVEWTITRYRLNDGQAAEISTSVVTDYTINPAIADKAFRMELPTNTMVTDTRSGDAYIVRQKGEKRVITREELLRGAEYEDFVTTATGHAGLRAERDGFLSTSLAYTVGACALALLCALVWIRKVRE